MTTKAQPAKYRAPVSLGLAEAKARLSEVIARAQEEGPQTINNRGRVVAYVVSAAEWERRVRPVGSLYEFLRNSPLAESGMETGRLPGALREPAVDFGR